MSIKIECIKSSGNFTEGKSYIASKKTYVDGYNVREEECHWLDSFFGYHMNEDFEIHDTKGVSVFIPLEKECCHLTEEERQLLQNGDYTREELFGIGGRKTCPKCYNK